MINVRSVRLVSQASPGGVPGRNLRVWPAPECGHARYEKMWDVPISFGMSPFPLLSPPSLIRARQCVLIVGAVRQGVANAGGVERTVRGR